MHLDCKSITQIQYFNPRSSCEERLAGFLLTAIRCVFQSTLLMRGATSAGEAFSAAGQDFNPRSSCEERLLYHIHRAKVAEFQSTLLMRGATRAQCGGGCKGLYFNPRSSCEERQGKFCMVMHSHDFNPRSSCEERRALKGIIVQFDLFQSTLLMRGATVEVEKLKSINSISIHAPHARSDLTVITIALHTRFQSTLLMRGATLRRHDARQTQTFQSTLLMRGATTVATKDVDAMLFQSTLLMRGATLCRHPVTAV